MRPAFKPHSLCVFMCLHILVFMCAPACTCVHLACLECGMYSTESVRLVVLCMHACECEENIEGRPTESTAFRKVPE